MISCRHLNKRAFAVLEYVAFGMIVMLALFVFKDYILRGLMGRHKLQADSLGLGRQYDPKRTISCAYDQALNAWYDEDCYDVSVSSCTVAANVSMSATGFRRRLRGKRCSISVASHKNNWMSC